MQPEKEERLIRAALESFAKTSPSVSPHAGVPVLDLTRCVQGKVPVGWYYGRPSPRSRALVTKVYKDMGHELLYQADSYADDLPYYIPRPLAEKDEALLIVPYTYDCNVSLATLAFNCPLTSASTKDYKYFVAPGFGSAMAFYEYMVNCFDTLYEEGEEGKAGYFSELLWKSSSTSHLNHTLRSCCTTCSLHRSTRPLPCTKEVLGIYRYQRRCMDAYTRGNCSSLDEGTPLQASQMM